MSGDMWREPARDLPIVGRPDVLVVGGGAAGIAAALASARRGAETWLIEKLSVLGGLAAFGLVNLLLTLDDGEGTQVVAGVCQEMVDVLDAAGAARFPDRSEWGTEDRARVDRWRRWGLIWGAPPESVRYSVAFDPEAFVDAAYTALARAGVHLRLHTGFTAAYMTDGRIDVVVVESKAGRQAIEPTVVIDTSGDGDVFSHVGAESASERVYPYQWFRMGGVGIRSLGDDELGDDTDRQSTPPFAGGIYFKTTAPGRVLVPWGGPGFAPDKIDPLDPVELTNAEISCRRLVTAEAARLVAEAPGFERAWLDDITKQLGITESRRLVGDYVLEKDDGDHCFADSVAQTGHWTKRGVVYEIPYRCLTTPAISNLLAAGRCISVSRYVHQATKEIPAAMATGEAAGAAAAMSLGSAGQVHGIDVAALRRDLTEQGAMVGGQR